MTPVPANPPNWRSSICGVITSSTQFDTIPSNAFANIGVSEIGRMSFSSEPRENKFPNRVCQQGALLCETVPCDAMTSGFVSDFFTVRLDDKGQTMLVICLQFTLSKKAKQSILTRSKFFSNCLQVCIIMLH